MAGVTRGAAFAIIEPVQRGREDIPFHALAQVGEGGLAVVVVCANVADRNKGKTEGRGGKHPTFLGGHGVGFGQVELYRAVDAALIQREGSSEGFVHDQRGFSVEVLFLLFPGIFYLIALDAFDLVRLVTIARLEFMLEGGGIQVGVGVLPEVGGRLPIKGHVGQGDGVHHFQAIVDLVANGKTLADIYQRRFEIHRLAAVAVVQVAHQHGLAVDGPLNESGKQARNPFAEPLAKAC